MPQQRRVSSSASAELWSKTMPANGSSRPGSCRPRVGRGGRWSISAWLGGPNASTRPLEACSSLNLGRLPAGENDGAITATGVGPAVEGGE